MTSVVPMAIVQEIENNDGELLGTEQLASVIGLQKGWMIKCARLMQADGQIQIIPSNGGRGHKTIYQCPLTKCGACARTCSRKPRKRNRNQAGLPRKTRRPR